MYSLSVWGSGGCTEKKSSPRVRMRSPPSLCRIWNRPSSSMWSSFPASSSVFLGSSSSHVWVRLPAGNWPRRNSSHSFDTSCMMIRLPSFCPARHPNRKGRPPQRKPASNGTSAHPLSSLMVHSPFPPFSWQAHNIPQYVRNIQQFFHICACMGAWLRLRSSHSG